MGRLLALALVLASCNVTSDVNVRATATPTPRPSPTPTASPTRTPATTPSPAASPSGSPTPIELGGPRGAEPPGRLHYVAIGASDTVGVGSLDPVNGSWPSRVAALMPAERTYRNLGVSGSLAAQAQLEQLPTALREQPTVVTVWLAVNDLNAQLANQPMTPQTYGASLGVIVDALVQGTSARIFVGNVPDLRAVPVYAPLDALVLGALIQSYNAQVAAVAAKHGTRVTVVDLFTGSADLTSQITVASDGFHPSDAGYALIAGRFADAMRKAGIPLRASP
ncbi:MAG TPA: SGNH/GDSL hydrolase family protein [Candidatus Limnocylindria bacterium]